jgi:hypothetical protein
MTKEFIQTIGRRANFWGYPLVATSNRRADFAKAPERILLGAVVPVAPVGYNTMSERLHQAGSNLHCLHP